VPELSVEQIYEQQVRKGAPPAQQQRVTVADLQPLKSAAPWPENLDDLLPVDVLAASHTYEEAMAAKTAADQQVVESNAAAEAAKRQDEADAIKAVQSDTEVPKARWPKHLADVETAKRRAAATEQVLKQRQQDYINAVRVSCPQIRASAEAELAAAASKATQLLVDLETAATTFVGIDHLLRELGDGSHMAGREVIFNPGLPARRDPLPHPMRSAVEALRQLLPDSANDTG
jgi:hypothetical protein